MAVAVGVIWVGVGLRVSGGESPGAVAVAIGEIGAVAVLVAGVMTAGVRVSGMLTSVDIDEQASIATTRMTSAMTRARAFIGRSSWVFRRPFQAHPAQLRGTDDNFRA